MSVLEIARTVLVTVTMDHTIGQARDIMKMKKIHHLLVMDGSTLVGVITDTDVRFHLSPRIDTPIESSADKETLETKIHKVMTRNLITVSPDTSIAEAAGLILEHNIGCLPVVDQDGCTIAITTDRDFLRYLVKKIEPEENH